MIAFGIATLFCLASVANIYAMGASPQKQLSSRFDVNQLMGADVKSREGEMLGTVHDFVIDQEGHVLFAVLAHEGRDIAVPYRSLIISGTMPAEVVLNVSREKLDSAPEFDHEKAMTDRKWAGDVYRYFGQQPYWTEEMAQPTTVPGSGGVGY